MTIVLEDTGLEQEAKQRGTESAEESAEMAVAAVRAEFPYLEHTINGRTPIFLDSAASAQKARVCLETLQDSLTRSYANVHRGAYHQSAQSTLAYEKARAQVAQFLGATSAAEVVFTSGATAAINLVANSFGATLEAGDEIIVSELEHHSNLVPWQLLAERSAAAGKPIKLRFWQITEQATLRLEDLAELLSSRTKLVAVTHASNAFGSIVPIEQVAEMTHQVGAALLVDGAQAAPHLPLSMKELGADFYAFSGHKIYGPNAIGVLWGHSARLNALPPWQGGGEMIREVQLEKSSYREVPARFEAGTPPIAEAIALGATCDWLASQPRGVLHAYATRLVQRAHERLEAIAGLRIHGTAPNKLPIVSFTLDGVHPHDLATFLDGRAIAVRTGHHCAEPAHRALGLNASTRASFGIYNTLEEIEALADGVAEAAKFFARAV